jgi:hypothetical protein
MLISILLLILPFPDTNDMHKNTLDGQAQIGLDFGMYDSLWQRSQSQHKQDSAQAIVAMYESKGKLTE